MDKFTLILHRTVLVKYDSSFVFELPGVFGHWNSIIMTSNDDPFYARQ